MASTIICEEKGNTTGLESLTSSAQRRTLADISNLQDQAKPMNTKETHQQQNLLLASKEYAEKLQKENMSLMKALAHRNKIIELSSVEFQKLKINYQHVQEKNLQLAQAHSQMLAELNSGRDRHKAFQHELGCKNALLMARKIQVEVPANTSDGDCKSSQAHELHRRDTKGKRTTPSIKSSGNSNVKPSNVNEKANNKRRNSGVTETTGVPEKTCETEEDETEKGVVSQEANQIVDEKFVPVSSSPIIRRRSARLRPEVEETDEAIKEVAKLKADETRRNTKEPNEKRRVSTRRRQTQTGAETDEAIKVVKKPGLIPSSVSEEEEGHETESRDNKPKAEETLKAGDAKGRSSLVSKDSIGSRPSMGRPSRHAAEKIQSYREVSLKVKMRRTQ